MVGQRDEAGHQSWPATIGADSSPLGVETSGPSRPEPASRYGTGSGMGAQATGVAWSGTNSIRHGQLVEAGDEVVRINRSLLGAATFSPTSPAAGLVVSDVDNEQIRTVSQRVGAHSRWARSRCRSPQSYPRRRPPRYR